MNKQNKKNYVNMHNTPRTLDTNPKWTLCLGNSDSSLTYAVVCQRSTRSLSLGYNHFLSGSTSRPATQFDQTHLNPVIYFVTYQWFSAKNSQLKGTCEAGIGAINSQEVQFNYFLLILISPFTGHLHDVKKKPILCTIEKQELKQGKFKCSETIHKQHTQT